MSRWTLPDLFLLDYMILAIDVQYTDTQGFAAAVSFSDWTAAAPSGKYEAVINQISDYEPGQFFKRELPCILSLIQEHSLQPKLIIIDGYVTLGQDEKPGLGMHLYHALDGKSAIIGVAKKSYIGIQDNTKIFRGSSIKPLFVTSVGVELEAAKNCILKMHGKNRFPVLLKLVDRLCRDKANKG